MRCSLRGEGCRLDFHAFLLCFRLAKDAKVAIITSRMGSIADNTSGGRYGYRMSKVLSVCCYQMTFPHCAALQAAVNMAGVSLARDLKPKGIAVGLFHPGRVATDMLGPDAKVFVVQHRDLPTHSLLRQRRLE